MFLKIDSGNFYSLTALWTLETLNVEHFTVSIATKYESKTKLQSECNIRSRDDQINQKYKTQYVQTINENMTTKHIHGIKTQMEFKFFCKFVKINELF